MNICAIIPTRMDSTRLPGKALKILAGKPMLWYVINRTKWAKSITDIIIATSTQKSDNPIEQFCLQYKVNIFRGSRQNVLKRYYKTALQYRCDIIIRITQDCPLIDGNLIEKGLNKFKSTKADYLSNVLPRTYPRGFDFEILSFSTLKKAYLNSNTKFEKEHITPYIWQTAPQKFKIVNLQQNQDQSKYRLTVDYPEDFKAMRILISKYNADEKLYAEIVKLLEKHPEISRINQHIRQKMHDQNN